MGIVLKRVRGRISRWTMFSLMTGESMWTSARVCLNTGGKGKEDLKSWTTSKINPTWMTLLRKKGQPLKLEKMVKLRGTLLISRKRWKGLEEMTKTKINTEIRIEIEIGTGPRIERGIDPGTETGKEAVPMITERKW